MIDVEAVRSALQDKLREMLSQHSRLSAHLRNEDRDLPDDWTEMAQFMENDEVLEALEERTRQRVDAIVLAVARIEDGIYTTCRRCGEEISEERLELLPTTPICASCA